MLEILYRDECYIAVHKPTGLFVHPTRLAPDEPSCMPMLRNQIGRWVYPVHRLDRATSGVLLFSLSSDAARSMAERFENRSVDKRYLAVVRGSIEQRGRIDYALDNLDGGDASEAITDYVRLAKTELPHPVGKYPTARYSLVRVLPVTGRRHQIRRHFAHIRHPVVGDTTHGDGTHNRFFRDSFDIDRLLLMATELVFDHPYAGETVPIHAPVQSDVQALFVRLGWDRVCRSDDPREETKWTRSE